MSTKIEWTEATWNPVRGCSRVSPGCEHCYAERMARRLDGPGRPYEGLTVMGKKGPRWSGVVRTVPEKLGDPLRWRKPRRVFVNSMSDLFHADVPDEYIAAVFGVMAACPQHTFQVLTKRAEEMLDWFRTVGALYAPESGTEHLAANLADALGSDNPTPNLQWPLPNVWLGVSAEDQQRADERIPLLLQCPAAVLWVSAEPLLGPIDFSAYLTPRLPGDPPPRNRFSPMDGLDWIVIGGESGPGARPCNEEWPRNIIGQCRAAGVPVFHKQMGARPCSVDRTPTLPGQALQSDQERTWPITLKNRKGGDPSEWPEDLRVREYPATG